MIAPLKNLDRVEAKLCEIEPWLQSMRAHPHDFERTAEEEGLITSLELLFPQGLLAILYAVEQTLICLGLIHGPNWLLSALRGWMKSPEPLLRPLTTLLFLHWQGIADTLELIKVPWPGETHEGAFARPDFNWLMMGIYSSQENEGVETLAGFLEEVFATFPSSSFPSLMRSELRPRLRRILKSWAKQGLAQLESRDATLRLFARLLKG